MYLSITVDDVPCHSAPLKVSKVEKRMGRASRFAQKLGDPKISAQTPPYLHGLPSKTQKRAQIFLSLEVSMCITRFAFGVFVLRRK